MSTVGASATGGTLPGGSEKGMRPGEHVAAKELGLQSMHAGSKRGPQRGRSRPWGRGRVAPGGSLGKGRCDLSSREVGPQGRLMSGSPRALTRQLPGRAIGQERRTRSNDIVEAAMSGQLCRRTDEVTGRRRVTGPSVPSERVQHPLLAGGALGLLDLVLGKQVSKWGEWLTPPPSSDNGNF